MVDSGATHGFMREEETRKVGSNFTPTQAHLNAVNTPLDQIIGVAEETEVNIGE